MCSRLQAWLQVRCRCALPVRERDVAGVAPTSIQLFPREHRQKNRETTCNACNLTVRRWADRPAVRCVPGRGARTSSTRAVPRGRSGGALLGRAVRRRAARPGRWACPVQPRTRVRALQPSRRRADGRCRDQRAARCSHLECSSGAAWPIRRRGPRAVVIGPVFFGQHRYPRLRLQEQILPLKLRLRIIYCETEFHILPKRSGSPPNVGVAR